MLPGAWRIASPTEPAAKEYGDHAYFASPHGELVLSVAEPGGVRRIMLTWKMRNGKLVIDQPSAPREELVDVIAASEHTQQIGGSWYTRDSAAPLDPEAAKWALVAAGGWYGVENATTEPFTPFLFLEAGAQRKLVRVVANTAPEAEVQADTIAAAEPCNRAVWVRDGRLRANDGTAVDAVLIDTFANGVRDSSVGLPYLLRGQRATIGGGFVQL